MSVGKDQTLLPKKMEALLCDLSSEVCWKLPDVIIYSSAHKFVPIPQ